MILVINYEMTGQVFFLKKNMFLEKACMYLVYLIYEYVIYSETQSQRDDGSLYTIKERLVK